MRGLGVAVVSSPRVAHFLDGGVTALISQHCTLVRGEDVGRGTVDPLGTVGAPSDRGRLPNGAGALVAVANVGGRLGCMTGAIVPLHPARSSVVAAW